MCVLTMTVLQQGSETIDCMLAVRSVRRHAINCIADTAPQAPWIHSSRSADAQSAPFLLIKEYVPHCVLVPFAAKVAQHGKRYTKN